MSQDLSPIVEWFSILGFNFRSLIFIRYSLNRLLSSTTKMKQKRGKTKIKINWRKKSSPHHLKFLLFTIDNYRKSERKIIPSDSTPLRYLMTSRQNHSLEKHFPQLLSLFGGRERWMDVREMRVGGWGVLVHFSLVFVETLCQLPAFSLIIILVIFKICDAIE